MSKPTYTPPAITVSQTGGAWQLQATSHSRTAPAGERLFRARPWPVIEFNHATQEAAEKDADVLRKYLANPPKKGQKDEDAEMMTKKVNGWWM